MEEFGKKLKLLYNQVIMNQKSTSFIVVLVVLLGAFAFVMFSPSAKKDDVVTNGDAYTSTNTDTNINLEEIMNQNTTQNDPLVVEIVKQGTGEPAKSGDTVTVSYIGTLTNGTEFDKSANHGDGKFTFQVGVGQVIKGWDEGIVGMKVGEVRKLTIAPEYGYGAQVVGTIPANSTLMFEVEMFAIKK